MFDNFGWYVITLSRSEASKARISLQISSIVTNLKEKQSEEFLASLILRTLAWWEKFFNSIKGGIIT